jgi:hypothetical protein
MAIPVDSSVGPDDAPGGDNAQLTRESSKLFTRAFLGRC